MREDAGFCRIDTFAIAKIRMSNSDGLAIERYQLLSDAFFCLGFRFLCRDETLILVLLFISKEAERFPD